MWSPPPLLWMGLGGGPGVLLLPTPPLVTSLFHAHLGLVPGSRCSPTIGLREAPWASPVPPSLWGQVLSRPCLGAAVANSTPPTPHPVLLSWSGDCKGTFQLCPSLCPGE